MVASDISIAIYSRSPLNLIFKQSLRPRDEYKMLLKGEISKLLSQKLRIVCAWIVNKKNVSIVKRDKNA
ncbi:hypothetical protein LguiA_004306 [Lonicera macranthoides]